jgi:hypothetical protein
MVTQSVTQGRKSSDPEGLFERKLSEKSKEINGRGDRIRTCDIYVPNYRIHGSRATVEIQKRPET